MRAKPVSFRASTGARLIWSESRADGHSPDGRRTVHTSDGAMAAPPVATSVLASTAGSGTCTPE